MSRVWLFLGVLLLIPFLLWAGLRIYNGVLFNIECGGHLKRAADVNTVELAKQEMEIAVAYLEKENMTSGYTSVLYRTPDEDMGFWYKNLKSSLEELKNIKPDATQLEKSNMLMKLRETLLDAGEKGVHITAPDGISIYPQNAAYCFLGWIGLVVAVIGVILIVLCALRCLKLDASI